MTQARPDRWLFVTIDTEVDRDRDWRIARDASFASIVSGVPEVLQPIFDCYGVVPTYLLGAEVLEADDAIAALRSIQTRVELGTHLHSDLTAPGPRLTGPTMGGRLASTPQSALAPELERLKLATLTTLFTERFGERPRSFRAGRFALGAHTHTHLIELGYTVDSSVTPGLVWDFDGHTVDYRRWSTTPRWIEADGGRILEVPVAIRPGSRVAPFLDSGRSLLHRAGRLALGERARMIWLRPSFFSGPAMVRYVARSTDRLLCVMFHSMEVIPGASPYAQSQRDVRRICDALRVLLDHCTAQGIGMRALRDAPSLL
jgi:hypothetical protein